MMFSAMLTDAFQDGDNGIPIRYRFDELRRLIEGYRITINSTPLFRLQVLARLAES